ncbi:hypothetical protein V1520DRAFT_100320 [Lipomyces starkeyi]|uniref:Cation transporter n=1 Tax=Lipomyces starkeyi NRRL Y-11557 TaxID=675824 RepID=A0A1E3PVK1_LIPST|nr:hypothetical protein LIPSTDRAFT_75678 [Lipomyces starkeyi NRRL Y-11557]
MSARRKILKRLRPRVHFLTLHYAYFIGMCFLTSIIFWGASTPARSVRYIDSLFLTISAMTRAGLNTVNLSTLNTFQQVLLFFLIILGSAVGVSPYGRCYGQSFFSRYYVAIIAIFPIARLLIYPI